MMMTMATNDESLFPYLQQALHHCSVSMAAQTDVWQALILYEYGGLYTNRDNAPGPLLQSDTIGPHNQAWFVVEEGGFLSQYVMAAALQHLLLFLFLQASLHRLYALHNVNHQYVPYVSRRTQTSLYPLLKCARSQCECSCHR